MWRLEIAGEIKKKKTFDKKIKRGIKNIYLDFLIFG